MTREYWAQYYSENKERILAAKHKQYIKNKKRILAKNRKWAARNKERLKAYNREYYVNNRERILARKRDLRAAYQKNASQGLANAMRRKEKLEARLVQLRNLDGRRP